MSDPDPGYMTVDEVARILRVDERTVRRWLASGTLRGARTMGAWRISRDDLHAFLYRGVEDSRSAHS